MIRRAFVLTLALALALALAAPLSAAELQLLTWKGYAPKELVDKFEKETGIEVKLTYTNNEEMIAKLRATRGAGFDLAQPSQDRIAGPQKRFNIYRPLDLSKIDASLFIASLLEATKKNSTVEGKVYAVPHVWGTSGMIVNTKLAADANDYLALCDSKYTGRVSYRVKRPTLVAFAFAMGYDPFKALDSRQEYEKLMQTVGDKLIACKPMVKTYWENGDALLGLMRSDEVYLAMGWDGGGWKLSEANPAIRFIAPRSGALGWVDTFAMPAKARNTDAAYKWINFMMRPEHAAVITNQEKYATAAKGTEPYVNEDFRKLYEASFPPAAIDNIKWYPPIETWAEEIEGNILEKVKAAR
jgi:spermidine/putrescine transport system substrate-binding protein